MTIKNQIICNDCGNKYFIEDAEWCIHKLTLNIGTKQCPQCHNCICHGETVDQIKERFNQNILSGKFIKAKKHIKGTNWDYQCKTIKEIKI